METITLKSKMAVLHFATQREMKSGRTLKNEFENNIERIQKLANRHSTFRMITMQGMI